MWLPEGRPRRSAARPGPVPHFSRHEPQRLHGQSPAQRGWSNCRARCRPAGRRGLPSWRTRGPADARGRVRSVLAPARRGSPTGIERRPGRWVLMVDRLGKVAATDDWVFQGGWR
jgi:hypothetical protein